MAMNKWIPESSPRILRRIGKTGEEASELAKVCFRIVIQGLDGIDPANGKSNLHALAEELADVQAQINCCVHALQLDDHAMLVREQRKEAQMEEWEALFADQPQPVQAQPSGCEWTNCPRRVGNVCCNEQAQKEE